MGGDDRVRETDVLREYYSQFMLSVEGLLKLVSVALCVVSAALLLGAGGCAAGLSSSVALACCVLSALLFAGAALPLPGSALRLWLYTDLLLSTSMGVLLLVTGVVTMTLCRSERPVNYVNGPVTIANGATLTASTALMYRAVTRRLDARAPAAPPAPAPAPRALDV